MVDKIKDTIKDQHELLCEKCDKFNTVNSKVNLVLTGITLLVGLVGFIGYQSYITKGEITEAKSMISISIPDLQERIKGVEERERDAIRFQGEVNTFLRENQRRYKK